MVDVLEVEPSAVDEQILAALSEFVDGLEESALRDLLLALTGSLESGGTVALLDVDTDYTPAQVAQRLRMSRTHLYKLLDSGQIPSHRVGRDRRVSGRDVVTFEKRRQEERRALAERFASAEAIRRMAQLAALLHDLGKASQAFQQRLKGERNERNLIRHEWVSLRLFLAFVG